MVVFLLTFFPTHVRPQIISLSQSQRRGSMNGVLRDSSSNEPPVGANILDSSRTYGASTDVNGDYSIPRVGAGLYSFTASYIGFKNTTVRNVKVEADRTTELDLRLQPVIICEDDSLEALIDIANGMIKDRIAGLIASDSLYDVRADQIAAKYGLIRQFSGCSDMCSEVYNRIVGKFLEKRYGAHWRNKYEAELRRAWEDR